MRNLEARITRLRLYCALKLPANYQSFQADIEALLRAYEETQRSK